MDSAQRLRVLHAIGVRQGRYQSKFRARHEPKTRFPKRIRRQEPWESLFMRKSRIEKREIIQRPWEYPMAAQHLSVILIQKRVRGMLCRLHLLKNKTLLHALNRRRSSASLTLTRIQSPMQRFIDTAHGRFADDFGFRNFTATRLQAWYRKEKTRWMYTLERFPVYHIAALQIQYAWKVHCQHKLFQKNNSHDGVATASRSPRLRAALALQSAWKRYTNRRIYRYYRDLITFQNTGDPARMLRAINPSEASLLDAAMGAHVRFRLGGMAFPPTIYYKIFTRKAVCDVNAFSPKDYTLARQTMPHPHSKSKKHTCFIRVGNAYYRAKQAEQDTRFWYRRIENNGWRPVTAKVVADATNDPVAQATNRKSSASTFHYSSLVRKQDAEKQRRLKKRMWMHKLYTQGLLKEITTRVPSSSCGKDPEEDSDVDNNCVKAADVLDVDFEHAHWEEDADAMFEWASALDYDAYVDEWQRLGKTASTDDDRGY